MAQIFYINKGSINPTLRMELIKDGRFDFLKGVQFDEEIQNARITFSMLDDYSNYRIHKKRCYAYQSEDGGCEQRYIIEYKWDKHDTAKEGTYKGIFEITFNSTADGSNDLYKAGTSYQSGNLIVPIREELKIIVK
jgi:hypothetical protein